MHLEHGPEVAMEFYSRQDILVLQDKPIAALTVQDGDT